MNHADSSWWITISHDDSSWWVIMMHHDEPSWCIMMIHRAASSRLIMMSHNDSSWRISMIHHDDSAWAPRLLRRRGEQSSAAAAAPGAVPWKKGFNRDTPVYGRISRAYTGMGVVKQAQVHKKYIECMDQGWQWTVIVARGAYVSVHCFVWCLVSEHVWVLLDCVFGARCSGSALLCHVLGLDVWFCSAMGHPSSHSDVLINISDHHTRQ